MLIASPMSGATLPRPQHRPQRQRLSRQGDSVDRSASPFRRVDIHVPCGQFHVAVKLSLVNRNPARSAPVAPSSIPFAGSATTVVQVQHQRVPRLRALHWKGPVCGFGRPARSHVLMIEPAGVDRSCRYRITRSTCKAGGLSPIVL